MKTIKVPKGKSFATFLRDNLACDEAREWVGKKSLRCAWNTCECGNWMLWLVGELRPKGVRWELAGCDCARLALQYADSVYPRHAIEAVEAWCEGKADMDYVMQHFSRLQQITDFSNIPYTSTAAYAAAWAARTCAGSVTSPHILEATAHHAAVAAYRGGDESRRTLAECADLVRARIPFDVIEAAVRAKQCRLWRLQYELEAQDGWHGVRVLRQA